MRAAGSFFKLRVARHFSPTFVFTFCPPSGHSFEDELAILENLDFEEDDYMTGEELKIDDEDGGDIMSRQDYNFIRKWQRPPLPPINPATDAIGLFPALPLMFSSSVYSHAVARH